MGLRPDLRPCRQVRVRVLIGLGVFWRRGRFSRTSHASDSNEFIPGIKAQVFGPVPSVVIESGRDLAGRFSGFGERGRLARRFRRLAENSGGTPLLPHWPRPNPAGTGWRDASQGDRDGRAPQTACSATEEFRYPATACRTPLSHPLLITPGFAAQFSSHLTMWDIVAHCCAVLTLS